MYLTSLTSPLRRKLHWSSCFAQITNFYKTYYSCQRQFGNTEECASLSSLVKKTSRSSCQWMRKPLSWWRRRAGDWKARHSAVYHIASLEMQAIWGQGGRKAARARGGWGLHLERGGAGTLLCPASSIATTWELESIHTCSIYWVTFHLTFLNMNLGKFLVS